MASISWPCRGRHREPDRRERREATRNPVGHVKHGEVVGVGERAEVPFLAGRHESAVGPVDARLRHRLADDEEVRERLRGRPGLRDDVDDGLIEGKAIEQRRHRVGIDVVEEVRVHVAFEGVRERRRAERAPADPDGQDRFEAVELIGRGADRVRVGCLREVQRGVAELVVGHAGGDPVVCVRDPRIESVKVSSVSPGVVVSRTLPRSTCIPDVGATGT